MFFHNLKTSRKLLAGFAVVTGFMVAIGLLGVGSMRDSADHLETMYEQNLVRLQHLSDTLSEYDDAHAVLNLSADPADIAEVAEDDAELQDAWQSYKSFDMTGREQLAETFDADWANFRQLRDSTVLPALQARDPAAFERARSDLLSAAGDADESLEQLMVLEREAATASVDDARSDMRTNLIMIFGFGGLAVLLSIALAIGIARMIARPLRRTVDVLRGLADGRLDQRLPVDSRDEVGEMAGALNTALDRLATTMGQIGREATKLNVAAEQMTTTSARMTGSIADSSNRAAAAADSADEVSRSVGTVVRGSAEMNTSIQEIARNATMASQVASRAVEVADSTNETISKLGEASDEIGNVIKVINSLAEQTNLLALNATIEAARAGESGKGFAVVASEVKDLAQETSKATGDIAARIQAIQTSTTAAVTAISDISKIIAQINETQSTIASAVEEQSATTAEISRSVDQAATGSERIAEGLAAVASASGNATSDVEEATRSAQDLSRVSSDLTRLIGQFRY